MSPRHNVHWDALSESLRSQHSTPPYPAARKHGYIHIVKLTSTHRVNKYACWHKCSEVHTLALKLCRNKHDGACLGNIQFYSFYISFSFFFLPPSSSPHFPPETTLWAKPQNLRCLNRVSPPFALGSLALSSFIFSSLSPPPSDSCCGLAGRQGRHVQNVLR